MKRATNEAFRGRDQLLERIEAGAVHVEGGLWTAAWRELIENGVSEQEAEAFFRKVQEVQHPNGSTVFKVRASEGRRVFAHGLADKENALYLLATFQYHAAIKQFPHLTSRGAHIDQLKSRRDRISTLMNEMDIDQLDELLQHVQKRVGRK